MKKFLITGLLASFFGLGGVFAGEETFLRLERDPSGLTLTWLGLSGHDYDLQWSENLSAWQSVPGFPKPGTGSIEEIPVSAESDRRFFRLLRLDAGAPENFVLIPAGAFEMGDHFGESPDMGLTSELPVHTVHLSAFYMAIYPVTWDEWRAVYDWALENNYQFDHPGAGKAGDHPTHSINWFDMVKWCNARSEKEGLVPAYYLDDGQTQVYRAGQHSVTNDQVKWEGEGYRLPTEAEWEKAARGGLEGRRFPWGDTISHSRANYWANFPGADFDESYPAGYHPDHAAGGMPYTSPVDAFAPNGYGLHDMAGNVWERVWDWYDENYYETSPAGDPRGPDSVDGSRAIRGGGSWVISAWSCRVSDRFFSQPDQTSNSWGFRLVRAGSN